MDDSPLIEGRAVVTGASGFLGAHLCRRLVRSGYEVVALLRPDSDPWRLQEVFDEIDIVRCELVDLAAAELRERLGDIRALFHLAAAGVDGGRAGAQRVVETNVLGTLRVLQLAEALGAERFVYTGSAFEYGDCSRAAESTQLNPRSVYDASKAGGFALANAFAQSGALSVVSLRPFTVYGPLEAPHRLVPYTIVRALAGLPLEFTSGEQTRDFVFVDDAVDAFFAAGFAPAAGGGTFNLCTGRETSIREVVERIVALCGNRAAPRFSVRPERPNDIQRSSGDPRWARAGLGWSAHTSLDQGLRRSVDWFRAHGPGQGVYANRYSA